VLTTINERIELW